MEKSRSGLVFNDVSLDFGFLPSTLGQDGDPLDIMVLLDAPAQMGCLIEVRLIGVIKAIQTEHGESHRNDRLLDVDENEWQHAHLESITDLSSALLSQVEAFFVSYNTQRGKKFKIKGMGGPKKAIKFFKDGMQSFKKSQQKRMMDE